RLCYRHATGAHVGNTDGLPFEVGDLLNGAVSRHGDAVDVSLIGGVKNLGFDSLGASGRQGLHARQSERNLSGSGRLDAVPRASQSYQFDLDTVCLVPAQLGGDGE